MREENIGIALYYKPAFALNMLRDEVIGKERFDYAFKNYIKTWAFKHPTPWDFFRMMNNAAGEDLSWFWRGWILNNFPLDQAVKEVSFDEAKRIPLVTIANLMPMAMPRMRRATSSMPTPGATADAIEPMMNTTPEAMRLKRRP